jgi:hypothetical protein
MRHLPLKIRFHPPDDESLVYKDAYGTSYMWDKVPQDMNLDLQ